MTESEVIRAIKQFVKAIGVPDALICDAARSQRSSAVCKFYNKIGTTLRVLEENTPWSNKAELYIEIINEATRKDMKSSDCLLAFWDYCLDYRA